MESLEKGIIVKQLNEDRIQITMDRSEFWKLTSMTEQIAELGQNRLDDKQTWLHFAMADRIQSERGCVKEYLSTMNFFDTVIRVVAETSEFSNDLWPTLDAAANKIK